MCHEWTAVSPFNGRVCGGTSAPIGDDYLAAYLLFARSLGHRAGAGVRPAALRSELAYRALRVSDSSPLGSSVSPSENFFSGNAAMPRLGAAHLAPLRDACPEEPAKEKHHANQTDHRRRRRGLPHLQDHPDARVPDLDLDRDTGVIRNLAHAFSKDGGLAVLYGNIAEEGCIVKTAGAAAAHLTFTGPARIFESQDSAVEAILGDKIVPGDVVLIRYEGPRGGPGMQEILYPPAISSPRASANPAPSSPTDASPAAPGLCIGHISPEAAEAGAIALVEEGDTIQIDIPKRILRVNLSDAELAKRRAAMDSPPPHSKLKRKSGPAAWKPATRTRKVSQALQAYAALTTSASRGAVRDVSRIQK